MTQTQGHNTPWTCDLEDWSWDDCGIRDKSNKVVIGVDHEYFTADLAALSFALRAVNSHDALLAALKVCREMVFDEWTGCSKDSAGMEAVAQADAAIVLAEGGK